VYIFSRDFLFYLPRERLNLWILILVFYPIWSAYPQELIYRGWFFHRYRDLVKKEWVFIGLNASLFSFSHIIFNNWLAIFLTFIGGIMFAYTYKRSNSIMVVFIEHMIYGNWIFTVGIGEYFYSPTMAS
ncbi:MAG: CPBP family intramembrane glutamic endopeptidase, partial [Bacteroidales bacterium]